jgi:hypothetical protein
MYSLKKLWKYLFKCFPWFFKVWCVQENQGVTFLMAPFKNGLVLLVLLKSPQWIVIHRGDFIILHLECASLGRSFPFSFQTTCKTKRFIIKISKLIQL